MLRAVARGWFSYDFEILDRSGVSVGRATLSTWRENADLEVEGRRYEATHKRGSKDFVLSGNDGSVVLVAEKPSAWQDRFTFERDGARYELKKESALRRNFVLSRDGIGAVGHLRFGGAFKRSWQAELPEDMPLEVRLFVIWLAVVLVKRKDEAAGGA